MGKYRMRGVDAVQIKEDNAGEIVALCPVASRIVSGIKGDVRYLVSVSKGCQKTAELGDFIVKFCDNFAVYDQKTFNQMYEPA